MKCLREFKWVKLPRKEKSPRTYLRKFLNTP